MQRKPAWFVSAALVGLGQHRADNVAEPFTAADMGRWVVAFGRASAALAPIKILVNHGYLEALPKERLLKPTRVDRFRLTAEGAIAARAALKSDQALPAKAYGPMAPADLDPFATRLWNLLRIRKMLTADEASCVLTDAGDDAARARRRAGELLLAWSRQCPHAVRLSARRVEGLKRYVLAVDIGATPPDLRRSAGKGAAA